MPDNPRRSYHHGDLRAGLVSAGMAELETHGISGVSLRAVARRAGVSQSAPAHHFGNKDGLLAALATDGFKFIETMQRHVTGVERPPRETLEQLALLYYEAARARPKLFQLMVGGALPDRERFTELVAASDRSQQILREAVAAAVDDFGSTVPVEVGMAAMWSLIHGLGVLVLEGLLVPGSNDLPDHRELVCSLVGLVADGLLPRAPQSS